MKSKKNWVTGPEYTLTVYVRMDWRTKWRLRAAVGLCWLAARLMQWQLAVEGEQTEIKAVDFPPLRPVEDRPRGDRE